MLFSVPRESPDRDAVDVEAFRDLGHAAFMPVYFATDW